MAQRAIRINFWRLSQDTVSKLQSIYILSILGCKQEKIACAHFNGYWQQNNSIIFWSSLMQRRLLVF